MHQAVTILLTLRMYLHKPRWYSLPHNRPYEIILCKPPLYMQFVADCNIHYSSCNYIIQPNISYRVSAQSILTTMTINTHMSLTCLETHVLDLFSEQSLFFNTYLALNIEKALFGPFTVFIHLIHELMR